MGVSVNSKMLNILKKAHGRGKEMKIWDSRPYYMHTQVIFMSDSLSSFWNYFGTLYKMSGVKILERPLLPVFIQFQPNFTRSMVNQAEHRLLFFLVICQMFKNIHNFNNNSPQLHCHQPNQLSWIHLTKGQAERRKAPVPFVLLTIRKGYVRLEILNKQDQWNRGNPCPRNKVLMIYTFSFALNFSPYMRYEELEGKCICLTLY